MVTVENRIGRLIEVRQTGKVTIEELQESFPAFQRILSSSPQRFVMATDWRGMRVLDAKTSEALLGIMRAKNDRIERQITVCGQIVDDLLALARDRPPSFETVELRPLFEFAWAQQRCDDLLPIIETLQPPTTMAEAAEDLVRSVLLLADVTRPRAAPPRRATPGRRPGGPAGRPGGPRRPPPRR